MLGNWIPLVLTNFGLTMFVLAVIFIILNRIITRGISESEIVYRWMAVFALGFTMIYAAIMHTVYPTISAQAIGWQTSPFQFEVGMADLAFGVLGILSFRASYGFRVATVLSSLIFLWGDAAGHIYQMVKNHDFAVGNAGSWFWLDVMIPIVLLICIVKLKREQTR